MKNWKISTLGGDFDDILRDSICGILAKSLRGYQRPASICFETRQQLLIHSNIIHVEFQREPIHAILKYGEYKLAMSARYRGIYAWFDHAKFSGVTK
jgi:hypothetical protein